MSRLTFNALLAGALFAVAFAVNVAVFAADDRSPVAGAVAGVAAVLFWASGFVARPLGGGFTE